MQTSRGELMLTLDIGTTAVKASAVDIGGRILAGCTHEYPLIVDSARNYIDADPERYWQDSIKSLQGVLSHGAVQKEKVRGIVVTTQGETLICVDEKGEPLRNAIVWLDMRARDEAEALKAQIGEQRFYEMTGRPEFNAQWPCCKLLWMRNHQREIFKKIYKAAQLEDYIEFKLTGRWATNPSITTSTGYMNMHTRGYWDEMIQALNMRRGQFCEIIPCGEPVGYVKKDVAGLLGIPGDTRVFAGAMDQICSCIGAGNVVDGIVSETTGTALVVGMTTKNLPPTSGGVEYNCHALPGHFFGLFCYNFAGILLKWLKEKFFVQEEQTLRPIHQNIYDYFNHLADIAGPGAHGLTYIPGEALDNMLVNINIDTTKGDLVRAIFENVAYLLKESVDIFEARTGPVDHVRAMGGGSRGPVWLQIKSDVLGKDIVTMRQEETTTLGAAALGFTGLGMYTDIVEASRSLARVKDRYTSRPEVTAVYKGLYEQYQELAQKYKR